MWIYFAIAFKALFCSRSPRGICPLCLLCNLLGVCRSNLQHDLHLNPFGLFVFFGLQIWPFETTCCNMSSRERGLLHGVQKISLSMSICLISCFKKTYMPNEKKVNSWQPLRNNNKWQEVGVHLNLCVHVWQTGICHVNVWRFPSCTVWKTEERSEDISGGYFGGEQCLSVPTSIPLVTDQDNSFPKQRAAWPLSSTQHEIRSSALWLASGFLHFPSPGLDLLFSQGAHYGTLEVLWKCIK